MGTGDRRRDCPDPAIPPIAVASATGAIEPAGHCQGLTGSSLASPRRKNPATPQSTPEANNMATATITD